MQKGLREVSNLLQLEAKSKGEKRLRWEVGGRKAGKDGKEADHRTVDDMQQRGARVPFLPRTQGCSSRGTPRKF